VNAGLNAHVEYLLAKPYPSAKDLETLCETARQEGYRAIVVPSALVERAYALAEETQFKVICTVGFPFGTEHADVKRFEAEAAADFGAHEIELVPSIGLLGEGRYKEVLREIRDVVDAADERPVNVVLESHLWAETELAGIVEMILDSGAQFVSTSIALQGRHASSEAIQHIRELVGPTFGLKVGGLKTLDGAEDLLAAGANRVGLAS
jgi:deoxyribose-phosphate aldolase